MKNQVLCGDEASRILWSNTLHRSGMPAIAGVAQAAAAVTSGQVVKYGSVFGIAMTDIPVSGADVTGVLETSGRFVIKKNTGVAYVQGQLLGYDFVNDYVTTDTSKGVVGRVTKAAASGDTVVEVNLNASRRRYANVITPSAGEDSANAIEIDIGFPVTGALVQIIIKNTSNVCRLPQGAVVVPKAGAGNENILTIADTGLVTTDRIHILVEEVVAVGG